MIALASAMAALTNAVTHAIIVVCMRVILPVKVLASKTARDVTTFVRDPALGHALVVVLVIANKTMGLQFRTEVKERLKAFSLY